MGTKLKIATYSSILTMLFSGAVLAQENANQQRPVGQAPPETPNTPPQVKGIPSDIGGILTPQGRLIIEPAIQYSHSSVNRITFRGVEILSTLLIGLFDIEDADSNTLTASLTGRLGVTDRLEMELKVPYVYRDSRFNAVSIDDPSGGGPDLNIDRNISGDGLGDIELAVHYQLNDGNDGWPFFIGNLRYKSVTGNGPFDIQRDSFGVEQELATGSGFRSIEPSLTALFPSDPAVFFANIGYLVNLKDDINERVGSFRVGEVDPGDALRLSFGMAYAINQRSSFTLGFKNDFIAETETELIDISNGNSTRQESRTLNIGALLLGWSYQINKDTSINLGLELGVTEDATDTLLTLRVPFGMDAF